MVIYSMDENEKKPTAVFSYKQLKYNRKGLLLETTVKILRLGSRITHALKFFAIRGIIISLLCFA